MNKNVKYTQFEIFLKAIRNTIISFIIITSIYGILYTIENPDGNFIIPGIIGFLTLLYSIIGYSKENE